MHRPRNALAVAVSLALVVAACGGSNNNASGSARPAGTGSSEDGGGAGSGGDIPVLTFPSDADASVGNLVNYNPYSPKPLTGNWLFEPLLLTNNMTCEVVPWLATDYEWEGAEKLTFTLREGVKWSDGEDFSADDVVFTLNLAKEFPAIDRAGLWTETYGAPAESVTAEGNQVVIEFTGNAAAKFPSLASMQALILPEHVYSKVDDPSTYVDENPVGTGPFKVGSYNGRRLELVRRDDYWQADKVKVQKLVHEGTYDASQAALKLSSGELDAYWGEIPNPDETFVENDPENNHYWYAPNGITVLTGNTEQAPFDDPKFREAISYAMDKEEMSLKATYGIMQPASQSGLKLPIMAEMLPDAYAADGGAATVLPHDPEKAKQLLDAAGYTAGSDGMRTGKDGSPLSLTFDVQAGFIDYEAMAAVVVKGFTEVGIQAKLTASSPDAVDQMKKSGEFQMIFEYLHGGCDFARGLGAKLATNQIPKVDTVLPNVQRYSNPETDETVAALGATTDEAERKELVGQLVDTMMTEFPVTSLIYAPARILYRTDKAAGWPTPENPYAQPQDDKLLMITNLSAP